MRRRIAEVQLFLVTIVPLIVVIPALSQQQKSAHVIGWLWYGSAPAGALPSIESSIIDGLRDLGYVEGKNLKLEYRFAKGRSEHLYGLASDLVRHRVDVIIALGGDLTAAAKKATPSIPVVMGVSEDPVSASLIASLARPGENVTGVSFISDELAGKRIELLKEINPKLSRVTVLWNPLHFDNELREIQNVARALDLKIHAIGVQRLDEWDNALAGLAKEPPQGVVVVPSRLTSIARSQIAATAIKLRIPVVSGWREFAEAGATASYGPDRTVMGRRMAHYIDRILKGAKPADLPVERPTKFEFVINLQTANQIGVTIPQRVLARADRVIR